MEKRPTYEQLAKYRKNAQDQSLSAEVRAKFQAVVDKFSTAVEEIAEKPAKSAKAPRKARATKAPATKGKKSVDDIEKAKAEIKRKTGKTEEECESIIEQYRALRTKAQEGKRKAEQASAENKKRVEKLDKKGDLIEGTSEKTADAVIETTTEDVVDKIEKQIEAVEEKAEKEAKAEVAKDKTIKTPKAKKEAVEAKVEKKVAEKTKTIVKRVVIDTSTLLTSIATTLGKFDKDSQKEFLIKLRSDIDKLLSKYAFGGMTDGATQVMNIQQSNLSSSSVNPSHFGKGGGVNSKKYDKGGEIFDDTYLDVSKSLKSKLRKKLGLKPSDNLDESNSQVYLLSYSDNDKDSLFDKIMIEYLEKKYPQDIVVEKTKNNGKDAFIFGNTADRYIEAVEDFGGRSFDDWAIDENYFEILKEMERKEFNKYLDDLEAQEHIFDREEVLDWLMDMRGAGYYAPYPNRVEIDRSELREDLEALGLVKFTYSKGGGVSSYGKGGRMFGEDARLEYVDDAFASEDLKDELRERLGITGNSLGDNVVISFAYTDYGGDFLDKVAIRYFEENYPENIVVENAGYNGQNAYVFGEPAQEWIDTTDNYPLGFENIEDLYYEMQSEAEYESYEYFLDDLERDDYVFDKDEVMSWLMENKGGYYSMTTQGLDFSYSDLTDELVNEGLIKKEEEEEYKTGGQIGKELMGGQSNSTLKPSGAILLKVIGNGREIIVTEDGGKTKERYVRRKGGFSGYALHYNGYQYEFTDSFAHGGMTEHGLRVGDRIDRKIGRKGEFISVQNRKGNALVNLEKGVRMPYSKGGGIDSMLRNRRGK